MEKKKQDVTSEALLILGKISGNRENVAKHLLYFRQMVEQFERVGALEDEGKFLAYAEVYIHALADAGVITEEEHRVLKWWTRYWGE